MTVQPLFEVLELAEMLSGTWRAEVVEALANKGLRDWILEEVLFTASAAVESAAIDADGVVAVAIREMELDVA